MNHFLGNSICNRQVLLYELLQNAERVVEVYSLVCAGHANGVETVKEKIYQGDSIPWTKYTLNCGHSIMWFRVMLEEQKWLQLAISANW